MKNKMMIGAFALLSMLTLSLTSCDKDDDVKTNANVTFSNIEVGLENSKEATVGGDLHLECDIVSENKIKSIEVKMTQKDGKGTLSKLYTDSKYTGVLNTTFHEHLELPSTLDAGTYHLAINVTDVNNNSKAYETDIKLIAVDPNAPVVVMLNPSETANTGVAGQPLTFKANITVKNPIKAIEIEFHGDKEYPIEVSDYNGKTGSVTFEKQITIPAECPAGEYHVHFTVEDNKGLTTTAELAGFKVTTK